MNKQVRRYYRRQRQRRMKPVYPMVQEMMCAAVEGVLFEVLEKMGIPLFPLSPEYIKARQKFFANLLEAPSSSLA